MADIICAGFGGQGVLTTGMLLAEAGMKLGNNVLFYPSYGSEMRGGTANCTVKISPKKIASPISKHPDIVLTLNTPAIDKFESMIKPGGLLLVNTSIVPADRTYRDDITVIKVPVGDIAAEEGNPKGANIAMLGVLAAHGGLFTPEFLQDAMAGFFEAKGKGKHNTKNIACFQRGVKF